MPHSLKSEVKSLCYKGEITEKERDRIIKALEQTELNPSYNGVKSELKPCEDCISREDILDAIETWDKFGVNAEQKLIRWQDHYVPYVHLDDVRNAIANMPSVTPKTRWIPCSERLPEKDENVLTYHRNESFDYQYVSWIDDYSGKWAGFIGNLSDEVLAWMSLPEGYKEEEGE